ncbi:hypothetical protein AWC38_SpisGene23473 [Stylophora pistillata]|uniref:Integrase catalytic domain-containing protein n=1 Tax=Stylophora pistillata TaxID=50429 RepID=A0A2B4R7T4_STYPI|nr:hypothetical protein AWC38_SpisGene23473 [Stylophora pistillata]
MSVKNREQLKTSTFVTSSESPSIISLIDPDRFSNLHRPLRVTGYVLRFVKNFKERLKGGEQVFESDISATDMKEAEQCWILDVQKTLRLNKKFKSWSREFDLFTDPDGLVSCRGRLSHAELPYTTKHPILLESVLRVTTAPAFTYTGLDHAGPLKAKETKSKTEKVLICLYTCCVTRALHLDMVPDLTPEAFLRSFRRFSARQGLPSNIVLDNGTTFKSASKQITELMRYPEVMRYLAEKRVKWIFNLERAPWWGGLFERIVRSVKRCLKKTIGGARLTCEKLTTVIAEVEMILNSIPLSYVSSSEDEPRSPSHLLHGRILNPADHRFTGDLSDPDVELLFLRERIQWKFEKKMLKNKRLVNSVKYHRYP